MTKRLSDPQGLPPAPRHGRGAVGNPASRFESVAQHVFDDGWGSLDEPAPALQTVVTAEHGSSILTYNDSPDIGFDRSINPYRGCEHGCIYCFARPSHGYLGLSSGLDFETRLFAKVDAPALLEAELAKPSYRAATVMVGANTDAYQPIERKLGLTRQVLEILARCQHPIGLLTKSNLVLRDLDVLAPLGPQRLVQVMVSVTTLDRELARRMEPRAPTPDKRLEAIAGLAAAGVPVGVLAAPMIPGLNDHELEAILEAAAQAGARKAGWVLLRLPHEIKDLFADWLTAWQPGRAAKVQQLVRDTRGGKPYDATFGLRMRGSGVYAELLERRFTLAVRRLGLNPPTPPLDATLFQPPPRRVRPKRPNGQMDLF